jgi:hypothetical protein
MKKRFVKTANYERFQAAVLAVEGRGAPEAGWLLVYGDPARGKSTIVDRWAVEKGAVYLRGKEQWTPSFFMAELAEKLHADDGGRAKDRFQRVVAKIGAEQIAIVIDEVQHALRDNAAVLEVLRDITDLTESTAILVAGVENVQKRLERPQFKQIASRIFDRVEFDANTAEDTVLACRELADVEIADDLVKEAHRQSGGLMRGIVNAISKIEQHAGRNKLQRVTLADMAGKELVSDWTSAKRALAGGRP